MSDGEGKGKGDDARLVARFASKLKATKIAHKAAADEVERLKAQVASLAAERDQFRGKADESRLAKANADLARKLRDVTHRARFVDLAAAAGADRDDAAELYGHAGYTPEADEPDDEALGSKIEELKGHKTFGKLFGGKAEGAGKQAEGEKPPRKPGPGAGQGDRKAGTVAPRITLEQINDPKWVMSHQDEYIAANRDKTISY